jgi:hypothetical protein
VLGGFIVVAPVEVEVLSRRGAVTEIEARSKL